MPVLHEGFQRYRLRADELADVEAVDLLARALCERLNLVEDEINLAHVHNAPSASIQTIVSRVLANDLDFREEVVVWKAHFAPDAQHLLPLVPTANWNQSGSRRERPFPRVCQRMRSLFGDERREIDVLSCHVIGYGLDQHLATVDQIG